MSDPFRNSRDISVLYYNILCKQRIIQVVGGYYLIFTDSTMLHVFRRIKINLFNLCCNECAKKCIPGTKSTAHAWLTHALYLFAPRHIFCSLNGHKFNIKISFFLILTRRNTLGWKWSRPNYFIFDDTRRVFINGDEWM